MRYLFSAFLSCFFVFVSLAQKLPDTQRESIKPVSLPKIDGKNTEWGSFSAFNKRTSIFYTIANDAKYIYLALQIEHNETITKALAGGITLAINTQAKKKEDESIQITFPNISRAAGQNRQRMGQGIRTEQSAVQRDSLQKAQRKTQLLAAKEIGVKGIKSITDSLISIYNEYGIKASAKIDDSGNYFYEMALPLSLLELPANHALELVYQIKLNGRTGQGGMNFRGGGNNFGANRGGGFGAGVNQQDLWTPTFFWGKYLLNK